MHYASDSIYSMRYYIAPIDKSIATSHIYTVISAMREDVTKLGMQRAASLSTVPVQWRDPPALNTHFFQYHYFSLILFIAHIAS